MYIYTYYTTKQGYRPQEVKIGGKTTKKLVNINFNYIII